MPRAIPKEARSLSRLLPLLALLFLLGGVGTADAKDYLIIGDSHMAGGMGQKVWQRLRADGNTVNQYALCGSAPIHWYGNVAAPAKCLGGSYLERGEAAGPLQDGSIPAGGVQALVDKKKPQKVIFGFGDNMSPGNQAQVTELINAAGVSKENCYWVTPPIGSPSQDARRQAVINDIKTAAADKCQVIDSGEVGALAHADALHVTPAAADKWGDAVADKIRQNEMAAAAPAETNVAAAPPPPQTNSANDDDPRAQCRANLGHRQSDAAVHDSIYVQMRVVASGGDQSRKFVPLTACQELHQSIARAKIAYDQAEKNGASIVQKQDLDINSAADAHGAAEAVSAEARNAEANNLQNLTAHLTDLRRMQGATKKIFEKMEAESRKPRENAKRELLERAMAELRQAIERSERSYQAGVVVAQNLKITQEQLGQIEQISSASSQLLGEINPANTPAGDPAQNPPPSPPQGGGQMPPPAQQVAQNPPPPNQAGVVPPPKASPTPGATRSARGTEMGDDPKTLVGGPTIALGETDNTALLVVGGIAAVGAGGAILATELSKNNRAPASANGSAGAGSAGSAAAAGAAGAAAAKCYAVTGFGTPDNVDNCLAVPGANLPMDAGAAVPIAFACAAANTDCEAAPATGIFVARSSQLLCAANKTTCGPALP